jgi:hypothetical protein
MHHMCETWSQHTWCLCSRPGFGPLKSGCDTRGGYGRIDARRRERDDWAVGNKCRVVRVRRSVRVPNITSLLATYTILLLIYSSC